MQWFLRVFSSQLFLRSDFLLALNQIFYSKCYRIPHFHQEFWPHRHIFVTRKKYSLGLFEQLNFELPSLIIGLYVVNNIGKPVFFSLSRPFKCWICCSASRWWGDPCRKCWNWRDGKLWGRGPLQWCAGNAPRLLHRKVSPFFCGKNIERGIFFRFWKKVNEQEMLTDIFRCFCNIIDSISELTFLCWSRSCKWKR